MIKNGIFLFILAFFIMAVFIPSYRHMQELEARNSSLENQIEQLKIANDDLANEKSLLENDPVYLESVAREKMGIARENEVVYKLVPNTSSE